MNAEQLARKILEAMENRMRGMGVVTTAHYEAGQDLIVSALQQFAAGQHGELRAALEESVKLQSHYAELLNGYDDGVRIGFKDADAWIARLAECKRLREGR
jgi:hypothetical protein